MDFCAAIEYKAFKRPMMTRWIADVLIEDIEVFEGRLRAIALEDNLTFRLTEEDLEAQDWIVKK